MGLCVTFGTTSQPDGLVVQNNALTSLGVTVNGSFTVDDVTFTAKSLVFDYTANPQSFAMSGTATAMVGGVSDSSGSPGVTVTFGNPDANALINDPNAAVRTGDPARGRSPAWT